MAVAYTVLNDLYGEDTSPGRSLDEAKASAYPILRDPAFQENPDQAIQALGEIYANGGKWTPEATDYIANLAKDLTHAAAMKPDLSLLAGVHPPEQLPTDTTDQHIKTVRDWRDNVEADLEKNLGPANWITVRDIARPYLDSKKDTEENKTYWNSTLGHDIPLVAHMRDAAARAINGVTDPLAVGINAIDLLAGGKGDTGLAKALTNPFTTNPEYDNSLIAKGASVAGNAIGLVGATLASTAAATALAPEALAGAAAIGASAIVGGGSIALSSYKDVFDKVYNETGNRDLAISAARKSGLSSGAVVGAVDALVTKGILGAFVKNLSPGSQELFVKGALAQYAAEGTVPSLTAKSLLRSGAVKGGLAAAGGGAAMAAQDLLNQNIESPYSGEAINYKQALEQGYYGAFAGSLIGAGFGALEASKFNKSIPEIDSIIDRSIAEIKKSRAATAAVDTTVDVVSGTKEALLARADKFEGLQRHLDTNGNAYWFNDALSVTKAAINGDTRFSNEIAGPAPLDNAQKAYAARVISKFADEAARAVPAEDAAGNIAAYSTTLRLPYQSLPVQIKEFLHGVGIDAREGPNETTILIATDVARLKIDPTTLQIAVKNAIKGTIEGTTVEKPYTPVTEAVAEKPVEPIQQAEPIKAATEVKLGEPIKAEELVNTETAKTEEKPLSTVTTDAGETAAVAPNEPPVFKPYSITGATDKINQKSEDPLNIQGTRERRNAIGGIIEDVKNKIRDTHDVKTLALVLARIKDRLNSMLVDRTKILKADPTSDIKSYDDNINYLRHSLEQYKIKLNAELKYGKNTDTRLALIEELGRLQKEQEEYNKPIDEKIIQVGDESRFYKTDEEFLNEEFKRATTMPEGGEEVFSSKAPKTLPVIQSYDAETGVTTKYSPKIHEDLRSLISYWARGFGLKDLSVYTHDEVKSGYGDIGTGKEQRLVAKAMAREATDLGTVAISKDGKKAIILLKDGKASPESVIVASHELGHAVATTIIEQLPKTVQKQILKEYKDAIESLYTKRGGLTGLRQGTLYDALKGARVARLSPKETPTISGAESETVLNALNTNLGFREFLADRVAAFINDPSRLPADKADGVYKELASSMESMWQDIKGYKQTPTLQKWFEDNFSTLRAEEALKPESYEKIKEPINPKTPGEPEPKTAQLDLAKRTEAAARGKTIGVEVGPDQGIRAGAKRILETEPDLSKKNIERVATNAAYDIQHREPTKIEVSKHIDELGLGTTVKALKENDFREIPLEKAQYYVHEVMRRLTDRIKAGGLTDSVRSRYDNILGDLLTNKHSLETSSAQYLESAKLFLESSPLSFANKWAENLFEQYKKAGMEPPKGAAKILRDLVLSYKDAFEKIQDEPQGSLRHTLLMTELKREAMAKLKAVGKLPPGNALSYYWNMNTLSNPVSALLEISYNTIETGLRTFSTAIGTADPRAFRLIMGTLFDMSKISAIRRAGAEAHGAIAGKLSETSIRDTRLSFYAKNADVWTPDRTSITRGLAHMMGLNENGLKLLGYAESAAKAVASGIVNWTNRNLLRHVADFRRAVDVSTLRLNKEVALTANVYDMLKSKGVKFESYADMLNKVSEYTLNSTKEFEDARAQAKSEYESVKDLKKHASPNTIDLRALEILDQKRAKLAEDAKNNPGDAYEMSAWDHAAQYAKTRTAIQESRGTLGYITRMVQQFFNVPSNLAQSKNPIAKGIGKATELTAKQFARYLMVSTNLLTNSLDYTPIGIMRGLLGEHIGTALASKSKQYVGVKPILDIEGNPIVINPEKGAKPLQEPVYQQPAKWSKLESRQRMISGVMGTTAFAGLAMLTMSGKDEKGKQKYFDVFGAGPTNSAERATAIAAGFVPNSVKVGDKYYKYLETPFAMPLLWLGSLRDQQRYNIEFNRSGMAGQGLLAAQSIASAVVEQSNARNLIALVKSAHGAKGAIGSMASFGFQGFIPLSGAANETAKFANPNRIDYKYASAVYLTNIPFMQGMVGPALNIFGEPLERAGRFMNQGNPDPVIKALVDKGLTIHSPNMHIVVGGNEIDPDLPIRDAAAKRFIESRTALLGRLSAGVFSEDEIRQVVLEAGPKTKARIGEYVKNLPENMTPTQQKRAQDYINSIHSDYINRAKINLMRNYTATHQ